MTTTSSESSPSPNTQCQPETQNDAVAGRTTRRFEINSHRDGAVFKVRYRESSIVKRCLLDQA